MDKTASRPLLFEVGLVCDEGTSRTGIHGLTDLFRYAGDFAATHRQLQVHRSQVRITHWQRDETGIDVRCTWDSSPGSSHRLAALVLPGNERATQPDSGDPLLSQWLLSQHAKGVVLGAVCGGVFVLARTGLLAGRQATTHWALSQQFSSQFPDVLAETDRMTIDYGDVVTAGGVLAWTDLGLRIVERFLGPTIMLETARYMNVDPPGREQRYYSNFDPRMKHGDELVLKAQLWLAKHREQPVGIARIADHVALDTRTLLRRFVKATGLRPSEYQQRMRVARAQELLEFSRKSVDQIASRVGYTDVGGFRRVFRKVIGLTPSEYRKRFCAHRANGTEAVRGLRERIFEE